MLQTLPPAQAPHAGIGFREFVALIAALMATNAIAIDSMLPALPAIGKALSMTSANRQQWIVTAYLLGFGAAQLIYGTLSDRYGRKPVLLAGLILYTVCSVAAACAPTFEILLMARIAQGIGASASRVLATSIVRDCYGGRRMAQVLSLAFIVFLAVPIAAPSLGQLIMLVAPWRWVFGAIAGFGIFVMTWTAFRLPETLHPEDRMPIAFGRIAEALRLILTNRIAVGYTIAMTLVMGGLFGFLNSAQQVFADVFGAPTLFPLIFGLIAFGMALSSLLNARIVVRLGTRRVSHTALIGYVTCALIHLTVVLAGAETIWSFAVLQAAMMFCFGLVPSNFAAASLEPLGHVAGTASSVQGFVTTLGGALLGCLVGQLFNGTVVPLILGFATLGSVALLIVFVSEKGRLFHPVMQNPG